MKKKSLSLKYLALKNKYVRSCFYVFRLNCKAKGSQFPWKLVRMVVSGLEIIINVHDITTDISDFMRVGFIRGLNASSIVNHDESFPLIRINCSRPIVSSSRRNRCRSYLFRPRFNFQGNEKPRISARLTMFFILLSIRS